MERIGRGAREAGMHAPASTLANALDELLETLLVALGPGSAQDAPLPGDRGLVWAPGDGSAEGGFD
jgi:hypothetical protein